MNNPNEHAETLKMKPGPNKTWSSILVPLLLAQLYAQSLLPSIECHPLGHFDVPVVLAPGQITKRGKLSIFKNKFSIIKVIDCIATHKSLPKKK